MISEVIRVDTVPPLTQITSPSDGEMVREGVLLEGSLEDELSGPAGGELSQDGGNTWQAVSMETGDAWSFTWHSNEVPNGQYALQMRGRDRAGNIGDPSSITLVVDNGPPTVSITERWWIWESGQLKISPNHFPIVSVRVTISDPQNRWPAAAMSFDPDKDSFPVTWDRRFADRTLAPSGEYPVVAVVCDIHDLCDRDTGMIVIPIMATSTTSMTPSPTATIITTQQSTSTATRIADVPTQVVISELPEIFPNSPPKRSIPYWQLFGLLSLFLVLTSVSVIDPRPAALDRLKAHINQFSNRIVLDSSKENQ